MENDRQWEWHTMGMTDNGNNRQFGMIDHGNDRQLELHTVGMTDNGEFQTMGKWHTMGNDIQWVNGRQRGMRDNQLEMMDTVE